MKVVFIMVGKTTNKHIAQLMLEYEERIKHYLPFEIKVVDDLKDCKALSEKEQKQREGERIQRLCICKQIHLPKVTLSARESH